MVAEVNGTGPGLSVLNSRVLVDDWQGLTPATGRANYDVAADGRFLAVVAAQPPRPANEITMVLNWFEELKGRVPVP